MRAELTLRSYPDFGASCCRPPARATNMGGGIMSQSDGAGGNNPGGRAGYSIIKPKGGDDPQPETSEAARALPTTSTELEQFRKLLIGPTLGSYERRVAELEKQLLDMASTMASELASVKRDFQREADANRERQKTEAET